MSYSTLQSLAAAAKDLTSLHAALEGVKTSTCRYSLLNTPSSVEEAGRITSDALFLYSPLLSPSKQSSRAGLDPVLDSIVVLQKMSISALIIAAGATSVLDSIQNTWPEFAALRQSAKYGEEDSSTPFPPSSSI